MNIDLNNVLKERISKYCNSSGNSIDSLCSKMRTLSTCILTVKVLIITIVPILLSRLIQNPVYSHIFLLTVAIWYLNKYTSIKDYMLEDIVRKIHAKTCESSLQEKEDEEEKKSNDEDPDDVPAPLS